MKIFVCSTLLVFTALTFQAQATGQILPLITKADSARLEQFEVTRNAALSEARKGGAVADVATLEAVIAARNLPIRDFDIGGDWKCRTLKVSKTLPLIIYSWFDCKVTDDGAGWKLEKLTGSQRTTGRFFDDGDARLTYLGSAYTKGNKPLPYASGPESDQIGYAFKTNQTDWRIEFPAPFNESALDILELQRK
jgi:Domain of unknown function (DUF4893)